MEQDRNEALAKFRAGDASRRRAEGERDAEAAKVAALEARAKKLTERAHVAEAMVRRRDQELEELARKVDDAVEDQKSALAKMREAVKAAAEAEAAKEAAEEAKQLSDARAKRAEGERDAARAREQETLVRCNALVAKPVVERTFCRADPHTHTHRII